MQVETLLKNYPVKIFFNENFATPSFRRGILIVSIKKVSLHDISEGFYFGLLLLQEFFYSFRRSGFNL